VIQLASAVLPWLQTRQAWASVHGRKSDGRQFVLRVTLQSPWRNQVALRDAVAQGNAIRPRFRVPDPVVTLDGQLVVKASVRRCPSRVGATCFTGLDGMVIAEAQMNARDSV